MGLTPYQLKIRHLDELKNVADRAERFKFKIEHPTDGSDIGNRYCTAPHECEYQKPYSPVEDRQAQLLQENMVLRTVMTNNHKKIDNLRLGLTAVKSVGHNDDCLFCGFKDKLAEEALR